jgi:xylulokinase
MSGRSYLGIDLGTTSFKGAVLDLDHQSISSVHRLAVPARVPGLPATRHELEPGAVIDRVRELLRLLLQDAPDASELVMCGQMHGMVLVDAAGRHRSNIITWKDQRATERAASGSVLETLRRRVSAAESSEIGGELRPGVPIVTLASLASEGTPIDGLYPASLCDFVLAHLAGREPGTDATNAAASGLYHLDRHDWHRGIIEKLGLANARWPAIQSFRKVAAEIEIGGRRLTCFTPVGDQQCALAGAALRERELSLNISTGSQVSLVGRDRPRGEFLVRPYFDDQWLRTIVSVPAGRSLQVLVGLLTEMGNPQVDPWEYIHNAVENAADSDLEVDLSFFASLTGDRGRIANIHEGNLTVGQLFAAAFRSMAANYARCAAMLSPEKGWERVVFSGRLALRFPQLRREILAALGNPPFRVAAGEEDTLRGLLALALVCVGRATTIDEAGRMLAAS